MKAFMKGSPLLVLVGQVVGVSFNSRVLLICDTTHALPVQVLRNDVRVIAAGSGCADDIQLEPLPENTDIRGDVLVTSGLGGVSRRLSCRGGLCRKTRHTTCLYYYQREAECRIAAVTLPCYYGEMIATLKRHYSLRKFIVQQMND